MENGENISKTVGRNLQLLRKDAKLTQLELAEIFKYSDKTISKWESGESLPSVEVLYDLAKYYHTTLDALTSSEDILSTTHTPEERKKDHLFPTRLIITLLSVSAVWLLATVLFVSFKIVYDRNFPMMFMWAIPLSMIVLLIFNCIWGRKLLLMPILSVLIWTTLMCVHLQFIQYRIWIIYILGIPLQIAVILWSAMLAPSKETVIKNRKERAKKKKEKKSKIKAAKEAESVEDVEDVEDVKKDFQQKSENTQNKEKIRKPEQKKKKDDDDDFQDDYILNK